MQNGIFGIVGILLFFVVVAYFAGCKQFQSFTDPSADMPKTRITGPQYYEMQGPDGPLHFDLLDPEISPPDIHDLVMQGFKIMCETPRYAKEFVGDRLSCTNCHFAAGNSFGGPGGGIALVGVINSYPSYSTRNKKMITLKDRLNNCFMRSMNGKRVPDDHPVMNALVAYLEWISKPVMEIKNAPWLGLPEIKIIHTPNLANGHKIYIAKCSVCHGSEGKGQISKQIPPVWGNDAYNDGAGMNTTEMMVPFIHLNMPYEEPTLSEEDAMDVAFYITKQPRPHLIDQK